nr:transposase [Streptomyces griseus]
MPLQPPRNNPERLGSEASFAALCGVSPVERSPGSRQHRRLNWGGDRQANAAPASDRADRLQAKPGARQSATSSATRPGMFSTWIASKQ